MIHIVLIEPEIPQNTGNIARTCAAIGASLHLVRPLGFEVSDRYLKRAGLDYWHLLDIHYHDNIEALFEKFKDADCFFATTKAKNNYSDVKYSKDSFIIFGKETKGLPEDLLEKNYEKCIRIPMKSDARSLNLSNSVAIIAYEALRQLDFEGLNPEGELTKYKK